MCFEACAPMYAKCIRLCTGSYCFALCHLGKSHSFTIKEWTVSLLQVQYGRLFSFLLYRYEKNHRMNKLNLWVTQTQWLAEMCLLLNEGKTFWEVALKNVTYRSFNVIIELINHLCNPHPQHTLPQLMPDCGSKYSPSCSLSSTQTHTHTHTLMLSELSVLPCSHMLSLWLSSQ